MNTNASHIRILIYSLCLLFTVSIYSQSQSFFNPANNGLPANNFTVPAGVTSITVEAWGAGGGGSSISTSGNRGGGGGGGAYASSTLTVTPGAIIPVTIGTGGAANTAGGTTRFNTSTVVAVGGNGATNDAITAGAGGLASASTGTIKFNGGNGANGNTSSNYSGGGGGAGGSTAVGGNASTTTGGTGGVSNGNGGTGNGADGRSNNGDGNNGSTYGGGGSGGYLQGGGGNKTGGSGANGLVVVSWCTTFSLTSTTVTTPICTGATTTVTLNATAANLPTGTYTVTYNRSAPNTATGVTKTMTVSTAGTGSFTTNALASGGVTTITITNLTKGSCSSTISANNTANITVNSTPTITGTTPGSRIGTGTVILSAAASSGTINWYDALTGGTLLGSGASFTTPSISATTTYYVSATSACGTSAPRVAVTATVFTAGIQVTGLGNVIIGDGTNIPTLIKNTDYGKVQITSQTVTKTFVINNVGGTNLTLGAISLTGPSEFSIATKPASGTVIAPGGTANITISFATSTISIQTDLLTIVSNDPALPNYKINLKAEGAKVFFDSDGDGVYDDKDIDDDNDGIIDSIEENNCRLASGAAQADYKFLNETFGTGITRSNAISTLYTATTSYCIEDGNSSVTLPAECDTSSSLNDGEYTVASFITTGVNGETVGPTGQSIASWAWYAWAPIQDHTPGDTDGRMAIFNADVNPGVFYETEITGTIANVPISYSFWVINLDNKDSVFSAGEKQANGHRILPEVTVNFLSSDRSTTIATFNTGPITRCSGDTYVPANHTGPGPHPADATYNLCATSQWKQFLQQFSTTQTSFIVQFINTAPGGGGNDLAIDDIEIRQTLCDMDHDSVADVYDLDSDDDGIPDVVEANPTAANLSEGKGNLTGVSAWVDANGNGMLDSLEAIPVVDTDGDGIPDYIDLDSDNDGLFDVDESGVINANDVTFQNGDGDITGNGVGDGPESETFRVKDSDGNGVTEGYGDGILDIYDFHEGNSSYANSYGNISQGTAPLYALDSDGDGIPNYKDPKNNISGVLDIDTVEIYAGLPHDANGVLLSTTDADGDGIMASRDGDDTVFGSPRNLNLSYSLYFDGRNDYVQDVNVISSGSASLMAFIKSDGANTNGNNRIIAGQDDFYIRVNSGSNTITAVAEGISLTSTSTAPLGVWMHVAVTTTSGKTALYINGIEEANNVTGTTITSASNFMIGRATTNTNYFKGEIDEVRVFNVALTADNVKRMVYQELDDANSFNRGKIIPIDFSGSLGANLVKYYKMDAYKNDILDNKKTGTIDVTGAKMYNFKNIYFQRAPLPYVTNADGNWTNSANWQYGSQWDIMSKQNNPNAASIVHIKNNINLNGTYNTQGMVGLIVDAGKEFSIEADKGLYNSWYLKLNGLIDLDNESQLIQGANSVLDVTSSGKLERDQQGSKDLYTYNYWGSPVGLSNTTTNNNSYKLTDNILTNGTIPATPNNITFLTSGYNGNVSGSNISIADYWIWKYANAGSNNYSNWQHVRRSGTINAGEGFTMKGVESSGTSFTSTQNYTFNGKPNNGDITLTIASGNDFLIGNPYASAIDADEFILDNTNSSGGRAASDIINGTLYFWDHFANSSHALKAYEGGYATYTRVGALPAISTDTRINASGNSGSKTPARYIPVSQGFFVVAGTGGAITFKNSQRTFKTEASDPSIFFKSTKLKSKIADTDIDIRQKIRLKFDSANGYHRQILVGIDENTTQAFDIGYDAPLIEDNAEDLFWVFDDTNKYIIQAVNNFDLTQVLALGVKTNKTGLVSVGIDALENFEANKDVFVHDKDLNLYHNLKASKYEVYLNSGTYLNRFEITFKNDQLLASEDILNNNLQVYFSNDTNSFIIHNPDLKTIETAEVLNLLGQSIFNFKTFSKENLITFKPQHLSTGAYIIKLKSGSGYISKKVLIN